MAGEKERGLSKINTWVNGEIYKNFRKLCIDHELYFSKALEEAMEVLLEKYNYQKEE